MAASNTLDHSTGSPAPYSVLAHQSARHNDGFCVQSQVVGSARRQAPLPPAKVLSSRGSYTLRPYSRADTFSCPSKLRVGMASTL